MNYKGFHQLQWEDRLVIEKMLKVGDSKAKIAEALGVCKKTIYNEIKRGWTQQMTSDYEFIWCYCPEMAERKYQENLRAKGPDLKIGNDIDFANYVEQKIVEEHYSPAALLAELKAKPPQFDTTVCEATLYNYIYRGDVFLVLNPEHLHEKGRRHYGEKYGEQRNAARAAKGPRIDKRDPVINSRTTFGHWEMDSVMGTVGSSRALVVLTERLTRAGIILPVPDHTAASVVRALNGLERRLGKDFYPMFQSITVDNGCEFQDYDGMEKACRRKGKRTTYLRNTPGRGVDEQLSTGGAGVADSGHSPAELHERLLICRTIKLNAGAHGGHRRCCLAQMQKNAQNKPQIARLILCVHTTLQVYCNLFLTFCISRHF